MSVHQIHTNLKSSKNFLSQRFSLIYDAEFDCGNCSKHEILLNLSSILAAYLNPDTVIRNLKGRDRLNLIDKKLELEFEHELLNIQCSWDRADFGFPQEGTTNKVSFGYFIITPFNSFDRNDIYHKVSKVIVGEAPPEIALDSILNDSRFQIESFRLGLDIFGQSAFANWFISAPVVLESILLECYSGKLRLRLQSEGHKTKNESLYALNRSIPDILATVGDTFSFNLQADLENKQNNM